MSDPVANDPVFIAEQEKEREVELKTNGVISSLLEYAKTNPQSEIGIILQEFVK